MCCTMGQGCRVIYTVGNKFQFISVLQTCQTCCAGCGDHVDTQIKGSTSKPSGDDWHAFLGVSEDVDTVCKKCKGRIATFRATDQSIRKRREQLSELEARVSSSNPRDGKQVGWGTESQTKRFCRC